MIVFPHNRTLSICHTPIPAIMIPMYLWPLIVSSASRHLCFPPFVLPAICASRREELTQTRLSSLAGVAASAMSNWLTRHYHISRPFGTFPFLQICHTPISPNLKFEFVTLPSPPSHIVTHVLLAVQAPAAADTRKAPSRQTGLFSHTHPFLPYATNPFLPYVASELFAFL